MNDPTGQSHKGHKTTRAKIVKRRAARSETQVLKRAKKREAAVVQKLFKAADKPKRKLIALKKAFSDFSEKFSGGASDLLETLAALDGGAMVELSEVESHEARVQVGHFLRLLGVPAFGEAFRKRRGDSDSLRDFVAQIAELPYEQLETMLPGQGGSEPEEEEGGEPPVDSKSRGPGPGPVPGPGAEPEVKPQLSKETPKPKEWVQVVLAMSKEKKAVLQGLVVDNFSRDFQKARRAQALPHGPAPPGGADPKETGTPPGPPVPAPESFLVSDRAATAARSHPSLAAYARI